MSSYKLIYEVEKDQAKAQVEGKFEKSDNEPKLEYKILFEGSYMSPGVVIKFIGSLDIRYQCQGKYHFIKLLSQEIIKCNEILYKVNVCNIKEEKDVLKIELDLKVIHCEPL